MRRAKRDALLAIFSIFSLATCGEAGPGARRGGIEDVARDVMRAAKYCALVTVDAEGRPRARAVHPLPPDEGFVVWIATRPGTRKVEQIRADPRATLYYFDAEDLEYVTLMGRARLVDDAAEKERRRGFLSPELYPDFPDDCLLIEVTPEWLEVQGRGAEPDPETWRPRTLRLAPERGG